MKSKIFLICLLMVMGYGCCKKQYEVNMDHQRLEKVNTIDTYNYKGIATIYYDTTVIVVSQETGDTLKENHSKNKITINDNIQRTDTIYIEKNDSIQRITQTIVTNELNEFQKVMMAIGITTALFFIIFIVYKVLRFFKKI